MGHDHLARGHSAGAASALLNPWRFDRVPLTALADPFDRFILATAAQLRLPLVTADREMSNAHIASIIW
jgi:PIN domain nuclease of toxin-antitoxin system